MMDRRRFLLTSLAGALATPFSGEAQLARTIPRIGFLQLGEARGGWIDAFRQGLGELGTMS
jgi:hypothetical protein